METLRGSLLLAAGGLFDPNFRRTVVLIAEHGEEGALGLVLNRPAKVRVQDAAPLLSGLVEPEASLFVGGPVQPEAVLVLAEFTDPVFADRPVVGAVGFADPDLDPTLVQGIVRARVFAGYSGWGPGQLEGFRVLELPEQPMQTVVLALLRPGPEGPVQVEGVQRHMAARLHELPAFRWRVVPVPLGLSHPLFVEDPDFDLARHVRHAVLPEPGGEGELDALCARLAEQRLDRGRPLWRVTLVDGLASGRQAIVLEIHHALMAGFAPLATLARIFPASGDPAGDPDGSPDGSPAGGRDGQPGDARHPAPGDGWRPGRVPGGVRLVAGAVGHQARVLVRLPGLVTATRRGAAAVRRRRSEAAVTAPDAGVDKIGRAS